MENSTKNNSVCSTRTNRFPPETHIKIVTQAYKHISQVPLPEIWSKLGSAFNKWLNVSEKVYKEIEEISDMHQYCNILLDDIQDNREKRGNLHSAHCVYGVARTLCAYYYILYESEKKLDALNEKLHLLLVEMIKKTTLARSMCLFWSDTVFCPTEEEYYKMIIQKSYGLLITKIKFMQVCSRSADDYTRLAKLFALYFGILDDYRRLKAEDDSHANGEDITLVKFSLPFIHAIANHPDDGQAIICYVDILRQRTKDRKLHKYVMSLLEQLGSFEYTKKILKQLEHQISMERKKFTNNSLIEKYIEENFVMKSDNNREPFGSSSIVEFLKQIKDTDLNEEFRVKQVLRPYRYTLSVPRETIVVKMAEFMRELLNTNKEVANTLQSIFVYVYEATLIVDDLCDGSVLRRGRPAAYSIYGIANTINAATYALANAMTLAIDLNNSTVLHLLNKGVQYLWRGQGIEIYWRDNSICPTEDEYLDMLYSKVCCITVSMSNMFKLYGCKEKNVDKLFTAIGQFFQINDDYQNLRNDIYHEKKGFCEDISEGKFGFPIVYAVNTHNPEQAKTILDILGQKTHDIETLKYCLSLIKESGSFDYTEKKIKEVKSIIRKELEGLGQSMFAFDIVEKVLLANDI